MTHSVHIIFYFDPLIKVNDIIQNDSETDKIAEFIKFATGNLRMVIGSAKLEELV